MLGPSASKRAGDVRVAPTRRGVLGGVLAFACAPAVLSCAPRPAGDSDTDVAPATKLSAIRYATLVAAVDALLPARDGLPGAMEAGAAWYIDQLLGAFDVDPPRIYAGGPYSGRHGGPNGFCAFQPLTRVEAIGWRTAIEGSLGLPEREFAGPVVGYAARYEALLDALEAAAQAAHGLAFAALAASDRTSLLGDLDDDAMAMLYGHACEGTFGDPAYGGNQGGLGWLAIDFEGDRQPLGYTAAEMAEGS